MLYAWMQRNDQYYRYCGGETSPGRIRQDLTLCPPGIPLAQKYYVGFFAAGTLVAVMDLVDGYPDADTAFIGFFMMNKSLQGRGVGTALVSEVLAYLTALGFAAVRLGIDKENPQSNHFWRKNGFTVLKEVPQARGVILLAVQQAGVPVYEYKPMQVKQDVVGYGNTSKHQVMDMTKRILNLPAVPKPDDAADAVAIALCHARSSTSLLAMAQK